MRGRKYRKTKSPPSRKQRVLGGSPKEDEASLIPQKQTSETDQPSAIESSFQPDHRTPATTPQDDDYAGTSSEADTREQINNLGLLGVSVHYLKIHFMEEIKAAGFEASSKIYEIENLRLSLMGVLRQKGAFVECPVDKRMRDEDV